MDARELYSFLRDPKLLELIELNKRANDVFDVVTLTENQNSQVLAWCMNPNEGHSQGDAVIKDFLEEAYAQSEGCTWDNKKFFAKWTPGRIRTTSFGSAFLTREYSIKVNDGAGNGRLDLFLVDPQNKILITIENKVKATLNSEQLEKYVRAVKSGLAAMKVFSDYDLAFIVIDKDLEFYTEEHLAGLGTRWSLLDYQWLESSAKRARLSLNRGNQSAQMLASYCQSVTQWENPANKLQSDLLADLALTHPAVVESMNELSRYTMDRWSPSGLDGHFGELTIFLSQHRGVCEKLIDIRGVASLTPKLLGAIPIVNLEHIDEGGYWVCVMPPSASTIMRDEAWAIYIDIFRVAKVSTASAPKFTLKLVWVKSEFDPAVCDEEKLRDYFEPHFKGLNKRASSDRRRVMIVEHVSPAEAISIAAETIEKLEKGLIEFLKKQRT
jgi:hypothetical protein